MSKMKSQVIVAVLAAGCGLALGVGYRAQAEESLRPKKLEQRVAELESSVKTLEMKVHMVESALSRTPRMGPQAVQQR
jgi:hypothetical protein